MDTRKKRRACAGAAFTFPKRPVQGVEFNLRHFSTIVFCGKLQCVLTVEMATPWCVCLLLQDLVQSCLHGGGGIWEDMCYERRLAEACVD
jgi:hypothetical protein